MQAVWVNSEFSGSSPFFGNLDSTVQATESEKNSHLFDTVQITPEILAGMLAVKIEVSESSRKCGQKFATQM